MKRYSDSRKRGCPVCDGVDPKSCMRCYGKTWLRNWYLTEAGFWDYARKRLKEQEKK